MDPLHILKQNDSQAIGLAPDVVSNPRDRRGEPGVVGIGSDALSQAGKTGWRSTQGSG